jgi:hypothetical protein
MIRAEQPGMSQTDRKVMHYSRTITAENAIFATTMGPQEAFTVAQIQVEAAATLARRVIGHWSLVIGHSRWEAAP